MKKNHPETMVISRHDTTPRLIIKIGGTTLNQVDKFKYLGTMISEDGRSDKEIRIRITQAKQSFIKLKTILTNKKLSFKTRERVLQCYVYPILMYGCEAWTITRTIEKRIDAAEMWFIRRMMKIPWVAKRTNKSILEEINRGLCQKNK